MDGLDASVEGSVAFEDLPTRAPAPAAFSGTQQFLGCVIFSALIILPVLFI
jgi:hypothetical protein